MTKGAKIIISFLSVALVSTAGVLGWTVLKDKQEKPVEEKTKQEEKISTEEKEIEITQEHKDLHKTLLVKDGRYGVYYKKKISTLNANDEDLIGINIMEYLLNNKVSINNNADINDDEDILEKNMNVLVSKKTISEYMNKKYNNNINYSIERQITENLNDLIVPYLDGVNKLSGTQDLYVFKDNYGIARTARSGGDFGNTKTKLHKVTVKNDELYLYDSIARSGYADDSLWCTDNFDRDGSFDIDCKYQLNEDGSSKYENPVMMNIDYILENIKEPTYKHTFKKVDNKYYYVSSERLIK